MEILIVSAVALLITALFLGYNYVVREMFDPVAKAAKFIENGNEAEAVKEYLKELENNSSNLEVRKKTAQLLEKMGRYEEAVAHYTQLIGNCSEFKELSEAQLMRRLARLNLKVDEKEAAFKYYLKLLDVDKKDKEANKELGKLLFENGKYSYARVLLERMLEGNSRDTETVELLALSCYLNEEYKDSEKYFQEAVKKPPKKKMMLYPMALAYAKMGAFNPAAEVLKELLGMNVDHPYKLIIYRLLAFIFYNLSMREETFSTLDSAEKYLTDNGHDKEKSILDVDRGFYHYFFNETEESLASFQLAARNPENPYPDIGDIMTYIRKMNKVISETKRTGRQLSKSELENKKISVTDEEALFWEHAIENWQKKIIPMESFSEYFNVYPESYFDADKLLGPKRSSELYEEEQHRKLAAADALRPQQPVLISKIHEYPAKDFMNVCSNIVKKKLGYTVLDEIHDSDISTFIEGDGVDYICYDDDKKREELIMISFRRWKSDKVGEIGIRDFMSRVREKKISKAMLILTSELTTGAKNVISNKKNIKVLDKHDFTDLLKGEAI